MKQIKNKNTDECNEEVFYERPTGSDLHSFPEDMSMTLKLNSPLRYEFNFRAINTLILFGFLSVTHLLIIPPSPFLTYIHIIFILRVKLVTKGPNPVDSSQPP